MTVPEVVLGQDWNPGLFFSSFPFFFFAVPCDMLDFGSLTTDGTQVPCSGSVES